MWFGSVVVFDVDVGVVILVIAQCHVFFFLKRPEQYYLFYVDCVLLHSLFPVVENVIA